LLFDFKREYHNKTLKDEKLMLEESELDIKIFALNKIVIEMIER